MGELAERARQKSPFIRIEIGKDSEPLIYKGWREIVDSFGNDSFRYIFEVETVTGMITKTFDSSSQQFANKLDIIPFGSKIILMRRQKVDKAGNIVKDKSVYDVKLANEESPF